MKLIGVTGDCLTNDELLKNLQQAEPYLDAVILREKSKTDEQLTDLIIRLKDRNFPLAKLIIHARPSLASMLSVPRVQLTGYGLSVTDAQRDYPNISFGCSVHSLHEALQMEQNGADWLLYGHVYETASKPGLPPRGTKELFEIASACTIPVYAIGGIHPHHLTDLQRHHVAGAALLSPMRSSDALRSYRTAVEKGEIANEEDH
ncbi:thiamine phosphate synthase [Sporosarcina sp. P37]|uniref:thiamine phosphate synthase n=2 Tax=unclassified Sporosarcina TaxID=2647733 RepID=UPI000A19B82C|nr:thiamine phosphate synthase [Sporosarcina sp. P37]PID17918.1 thiamine phosphate synthase [Sporosarcina sp. P35]